MVTDIGGTTTDIAVLSGGRPRLEPQGAKVGGWLTMVEAVAMRTHGLGGDSEVGLAPGLAARFTLGPRRATPVSLYAAERPEALEAMAAQLARPRSDPHDGVFVLPGARRSGFAELGAQERDVMDAAEAGASVEALALGPRGRPALERLVGRGFLRRAAFTPTDAAHVLGTHGAWSREGAQMAAALFARRKGDDGRPVAEDAAALSERVIEALKRRSAELVLEAALSEDGFEAEGLAASPLGAAALDARRGWAAPALTLTRPLIGLGASAAAYYPGVARLVGADAAIPADADVANAVGAVTGRVEARAEATILSPDGERFDVIAGGAPVAFAALREAKAHAETWARAEARRRAEAAGMEIGEVDPGVVMAWEERRAAVEARDVLVEARLIATLSGRPRVGGAG